MIDQELEPTNNTENNTGAENIVSEKTELSAENSTAQTETLESSAANAEETSEATSADAATDSPQSSLDANASAEEPQNTAIPTSENMTEVTRKPENEIEDIEEIEEEVEIPDFDENFDNFEKKDFVALADKMLEAMNARNLSVSDVKNIDNVIKAIHPAFDEINIKAKKDAKKAYVAENGSDEGFEFKNDNYAIRFEGILIQIREKRNAFFQKLEREREDYFEIKTRLLQQLRDIVEVEEKGESKNNWDAFKKLQSDWKNAGNVNSPHNGTLWSAYNALVDRYFDIRSIQNELKDLDRKKNIELKEEAVVKIEEIAETLKNAPLTNATLKKANDLLNEYKQIGPGIREEQDALWARLKKAFDLIYDKKRELATENQSLMEDIYNAKAQILENLKPFLSFDSDSINEWNAKSKEVMAIQDQWNSIKGPMPREKGKDISKDFWATLKHFFKNKSEFFAKLEAKREANLKAKEALCVEADAILAAEDHSAPNTNRIIELQKKWKSIGQVPEKYKDSLYNRFKAACDKYFDLKRNENKAQDEEFKANLAKKEAICNEIENLVKAGDANLAKLSEYKKNFGAIGFVPRKDIQSIQTRFINAINDYVKAASGLDKSEKDKLMLQNEVEVVLKSGGGSKNLDKQENDIRRKIKGLEDEISLTKNNMEFFGFSKGAEKLKEEYLKKVTKAEIELKELQDKLKLIVAAN
ncbi:DUF349 domain-containing protein [Lacihabitans lacunae]|uniref:DUF349 domain-containing protein n=1 Tax=Lacihabitans lacunae TaxID=1028214 RepID=A0ABV7YQT9_9BACT